MTVIFKGTLAGLSLDAALFKLPARKRIGAVACAIFARGNDQAAKPLLLDLAIASVLTVAHFLAASKAAPVMLSIKDAPDDERALSAKLGVFARRHAVRSQLIGSRLMGR